MCELNCETPCMFFYTETAEIVSNLALGILEDFMEHVLASVNDK